MEVGEAAMKCMVIPGRMFLPRWCRWGTGAAVTHQFSCLWCEVTQYSEISLVRMIKKKKMKLKNKSSKKSPKPLKYRRGAVKLDSLN